MEISVCCISDTHGLHRRMKEPIPNCDILIHSGDYTNRGGKEDVEDFYKWLTEQRQCTLIVFIEGNHDIHAESRFNWETESELWFEDMMDKYQINHDTGNISRLCGNSVNLMGLKIWGSPITPDFYPEHWAFNKPRGEEIRKVWNSIPVDTDIVLTHGPAEYKHDYIPHQNKFVGCADLSYRLQEINPKLHICGHIHEGYGMLEEHGTIYINPSICNGSYHPVNKPILVTLEV